MKQLLNTGTISKRYLAIIGLFFFQSILWAQDKKIDVNLSVGKEQSGNDWFEQPWVWVVGGAVFIIVIVALMRSNSKN